MESTQIQVPRTTLRVMKDQVTDAQQALERGERYIAADILDHMADLLADILRTA